MDALSAILATHQVRGAILADGHYHAPWGILVDQPSVAGFHIVVGGTCVLRLEGSPTTRLHQGDVVVVPNGARHVLANDESTPPVPLSAAHFTSQPRDVDDTWLACGAFQFPRGVPSGLMSALPPVIVLRGPELQRDTVLGPLLRVLTAELGSTAPGAQLLVDRLTDAIFVGVIRAFLARDPAPCTGWLQALRDEGLARALAAMHGDPATEWTVPELARKAGMSRATFTRRFDNLVGDSPAAYLQRLRLERARHLLLDERHSVAEVAAAVGYASEFSFSRSFKRAYGHPPSHTRAHRHDDAVVPA